MLFKYIDSSQNLLYTHCSSIEVLIMPIILIVLGIFFCKNFPEEANISDTIPPLQKKPKKTHWFLMPIDPLFIGNL